MTTADGLRLRWRRLWQSVTGVDGDPIFDDLVARYAEPQRAYHTLEHIAECLNHLDSARHLLQRPAEAEIAFWFHDAIYDPRRNDNEERSALLAEEALRAAGSKAETARRVGDLIRLTTHRPVPLAGDEALFVDIDLAILGAVAERFDRYDADIRREYDWVPTAAFAEGRGRLLAAFMERPHIYHSDFFRDRLETRARQNLGLALQRYREQQGDG